MFPFFLNSTCISTNNKTLHLKSLAQKQNKQTKSRGDKKGSNGSSHGSRLRPSHPRCHRDRDRPNHGRHDVRRGAKRHGVRAAGCGGTGCGGCGGCGHASWAAKCQGVPSREQKQLEGSFLGSAFKYVFFSLHLYVEEIIPFFDEARFFLMG